MERFAPGNQRVTTVVPGTSDTPLLPAPKSANSSHTCHMAVASPINASAVAPSAAPPSITQRTSQLSMARPTATPQMPLARNSSATAAERSATANPRSAASAFM